MTQEYLDINNFVEHSWNVMKLELKLHYDQEIASKWKVWFVLLLPYFSDLLTKISVISLYMTITLTTYFAGDTQGSTEPFTYFFDIKLIY